MFVCCKVCGKGFENCGRAFGFACDSCGDCICPRDRPSPVFVFFSLALNLAGFFVSVLGVIDSTKCDNSKVGMWGLVNMGLCALNIIFAFYVYRQFSLKVSQGEGHIAGGMKILMLDMGVYFYIFVFIGCIIWAVMGNGWADDEDSCVDKADKVKMAVMIMGVYLGAGLFVLLCSFLCRCGPQKRPMPPKDTQQPFIAGQPPPGNQQQVQQPYQQQAPQPAHPGYPPQPVYPQQQPGYPQQGPPPQQVYPQAQYGQPQPAPGHGGVGEKMGQAVGNVIGTAARKFGH